MDKLYLTWTDIENMVRDVMSKADKPDVLIGISRGGCIPAIMASQLIEVPMIPITWQTRDARLREVPESIDRYKEKKILVLDDINDSGKTLCELYGELSKRNYKNVQWATMLEKPKHSRFRVNYYSKKILDNTWIVFPWEIQ